MSIDVGGRNRIHKGKEIIIQARSLLAAQRAANLVHSAILLLSAGLAIGEEHEVFPARSLEHESRDEETQKLLRNNILSKSNIPRACMIAAKASFRREYSYALAKLRLSYEMCSTPTVELDPHYSALIPKSPYAEHHVRFAYGVILAYSVIEEIGMEIRASQSRPSTINGKWNPVVKGELEQRLRQAGVNLDEPFLWSVRGSATRLERSRPARKISKVPWSRYDVRDGMVELADAIAHVSWLRSKVAAHRMQENMVSILSVYDVANAQFLARRLLLERMGFWQFP